MSGAAQVLAGAVVYVCAPEGPPLDGERAAADLVGEAFSCGARLVAAPVSRLAPGFLTLSTRIAGEVAQKFVNYGLQLAIVGDVSAAAARSRALGDFIHESNRGRHLWFVADLAELEARLAAP